MYPEIHLLGLSLKTFGICFALAFIFAGVLVAWRLRELGKPVDYSYEVVLSAVVGGLVGSRLYWIVQNWSVAKEDLLGSLFSGAGLVWYGGAIGGALAVLVWAKWRDMFNATMLDLVAPALALGYAVGRIGCQLSGDGDYGRASDLPWAMAYPDGVVPTTEQVHPTPVYETLAMGFVALWLWKKRTAYPPGKLFACYLLFAGVERLLVEFVRRNDAVVVSLTLAQLESILLIVAGAVYFWRCSQKQELAKPIGEKKNR